MSYLLWFWIGIMRFYQWKITNNKAILLLLYIQSWTQKIWYRNVPLHSQSKESNPVEFVPFFFQTKGANKHRYPSTLRFVSSMMVTLWTAYKKHSHLKINEIELMCILHLSFSFHISSFIIAKRYPRIIYYQIVRWRDDTSILWSCV